MKINLQKNTLTSFLTGSIRGRTAAPPRGPNFEAIGEPIFTPVERGNRVVAFEHPQVEELCVPCVVENAPLNVGISPLQAALNEVQLKSIEPISCSSWDAQISRNRYDLFLREKLLRVEAQYSASALKNSHVLAKDLYQRIEAQFLTSRLKNHKLLEIEKQYVLSARQNSEFMAIEQLEPQDLLLKPDKKLVLILDQGGGLKPPRGPKKGFGGNGDWSGDDGYFSGSNPYIYALFSLLFTLICYIGYRYGLSNFERAVDDMQRQLEEWFAKGPKNQKRKWLYALFLKSLIILMALFGGPEAFGRALGILANPFLRNFIRIMRFFARFSLALGLLLGVSPQFLDLYQFLMYHLGPLFDRTIKILAGPGNISLPILFLEKLLKVQCASVLCSSAILYFQKSLRSKRFFDVVLVISFCLAVYLVLFDFVHIRNLALGLSHNQIVHKLLGCQTGRLLLMMGSTFLLNYFTKLPYISVVYLIFIYSLGVLSLAISASPNAFPIK